MQAISVRAARPQLVRGTVAGLVALAGLVAGDLAGGVRDAPADERAIALAGAAVALLSGIVAVRAFGAAIRKGAEARQATARGASLAFVTSVVGYIIVVIAVLGLLEVDLSGLLLGGAVTGVVVGIAAQQTIGNFFAGIVLLAARPFTIGEHVVLRSGPLGGEYEGRVTDMSLFYVHMHTDRGPVQLPNAGVLASAIGPGARSATDDDIEEEGT